MASLTLVAPGFLWISLSSEPEDFRKPLPSVSEPLKESLAVMLMFVYWSLFLYRTVRPFGYLLVLVSTIGFGFVMPVALLLGRGNRIEFLGLKTPKRSDMAFPLLLCLSLAVGGIVRMVLNGFSFSNLVQIESIGADLLLLGGVMPFAEEFVFRCVMQNRISLALGSRIGGLLATAVVFASLHIATAYVDLGFTIGSPLIPLTYALITRLPLGLLLGTIWNRSESIAGSWAVHSVNNVIVIVMENLM